MSLLITRPRYDDATHYLFHWSQVLVSEAQSSSVIVYDLPKEKATKRLVESYLRKNRPTVIFFNGHGSRTEMLGHENEVLICKNNNENLLRGSNVYMRACDAGSELGYEIVKAGAKGFIGYSRPFTFMIDPETFQQPLKDDYAKPFLECSNQVARSLIKGHSVKEAHESSLKEYKRKISSLLTSANTNSFLLPWLVMNQVSQVCLEGGSP
jgi:hypothetical protein